MLTFGFFRQCSQGGLSLLAITVIPLTLAEGALAQVQRPDIETGKPQFQTFVTKVTDLPTYSQPDHPVLLSDSLTSSLTPTAPPPSVINVETLQSEPVDFATSVATLEGTDDFAVAPTAIVLPNAEAASVNLPAPATAAAPATTMSYALEGYVANPEAIPLGQANAETATPADESLKWRASLWGGIMTDNDLEESLIFQGIELEDSGLVGLGVSRTITGGNSIKLEGELQLFHHFGRQDHVEGTAALAVRWKLSPSFSVALVEGVSYATALPEIEDENNTDESQLLNYLALELEYLHTPRWGIAGRLHHRSGAFRLFGGAVGGSNAYLLGLRHRF